MRKPKFNTSPQQPCSKVCELSEIELNVRVFQVHLTFASDVDSSHSAAKAPHATRSKCSLNNFRNLGWRRRVLPARKR